MSSSKPNYMPASGVTSCPSTSTSTIPILKLEVQDDASDLNDNFGDFIKEETTSSSKYLNDASASITDIIPKPITCQPLTRQEQYNQLQELKSETKQLQQVYFDSVRQNQTLLKSNVSLNQTYSNAIQENLKLKRHNLNLKQMYLNQSEDNEMNVTELEKTERNISQCRGSLASCKRNFDETYRPGLRDFFTDGQLDILLESNKGPVRWHDVDLIKARKLYQISREAYKMIRDEWKFPLPDEELLKECGH